MIERPGVWWGRRDDPKRRPRVARHARALSHAAVVAAAGEPLGDTSRGVWLR